MVTRPGKSAKVSLLLRRCEFFADRVVVPGSAALTGGVAGGEAASGTRWGPDVEPLETLAPVEVEATFVHTREYRPVKDAWVLRKRLVALPSRLYCATQKSSRTFVRTSADRNNRGDSQ